MKLQWVSTAVDDLDEIYRFVAQDDPNAARRTISRIRNHIVSSLPTAPNMGRPGRVAGTRELVVTGTPYIVPYRVKDDIVEVLRVYHGARKWPSEF